MVVAGKINNSAVCPDHLLGVAGIIGASTGVVHDKSVVVELVLYHVCSKLLGQQRRNFALRHNGNILGRQEEHANRNGREHLHVALKDQAVHLVITEIIPICVGELATATVRPLT